jgi:putative aldouronate transport system permease protein
MGIKDSFGRKLFLVLNGVFLIALACICLMPLINIASLSLSSKTAAMSGYVKLWPVDFTLKAYQFAFSKPAFWSSVIVSFTRVGLGGAINIFLTLMVAYPLSKEASQFRWRTMYVWIFFITTLFSGGLIPSFILVKELKLQDTIWALVLPGAMPVFNAILLLNFFRGIPKELEDAAAIDGAGHWTILWKIFVPISLPALATIILFSVVGHWNSWFDGLIYMNRIEHYPLLSYLQTMLIGQGSLMRSMSKSEIQLYLKISDRTVKAAQIFISAIPVLMVYPFLQRYFVKGLVIGSVKG